MNYYLHFLLFLAFALYFCGKNQYCIVQYYKYNKSNYASTVGAKIMTHTRIMACGTSGDDLMHLKTSHNKSRVIL